jgi:hypothetical protein
MKKIDFFVGFDVLTAVVIKSFGMYMFWKNMSRPSLGSKNKLGRR